MTYLLLIFARLDPNEYKQALYGEKNLPQGLVFWIKKSQTWSLVTLHHIFNCRTQCMLRKTLLSLPDTAFINILKLTNEKAPSLLSNCSLLVSLCSLTTSKIYSEIYMGIVQ